MCKERNPGECAKLGGDEKHADITQHFNEFRILSEHRYLEKKAKWKGQHDGADDPPEARHTLLPRTVRVKHALVELPSSCSLTGE